ncbi:Rne/Rng family ribonuclease [Thermosulfuriphilus sp.]
MVRVREGRRAQSKKVILINADQPEEIRVALVEEGRLEAFDLETVVREHTRGNIYKGRIVNIEPSLQAVFVDIGSQRNAYLSFEEIHPEYYGYAKVRKDGRSRLPEFLELGQEVLVQIVKEETPTKGANVTTYLAIPGRYTVLMPGNPSTGISRKIEDEAERKRLKDIIASFKLPEGIGVVVRTASAGVPKREIHKDLRYLLRLWREIKRQASSIEPPAILYKDQDVIIRFLRDHLTGEVSEILVDSKEAYRKIKDFLKVISPRQTKVVHLFRERRPIFSLYNLEEQIESIYQPKVELPSGGTLIIEPTEALVAIDVNSGKNVQGDNLEEVSFRTNLEAAAEIARQLRLRDLGGLIVIDFIDMRDPRHRQEVERRLRESLKKDRAKVDMTRISKFGVLELARQKLKAPIAWGSHRICPYCRGEGMIRTVETLVLSHLRRLRAQMAAEGPALFRLVVPPEVAFYLLNRKRRELLSLEEEYQGRIEVVISEEMLPEDGKIETLPLGSS